MAALDKIEYQDHGLDYKPKANMNDILILNLKTLIMVVFFIM